MFLAGGKGRRIDYPVTEDAYKEERDDEAQGD
jgi:hypothetical protein